MFDLRNIAFNPLRYYGLVVALAVSGFTASCSFDDSGLYLKADRDTQSPYGVSESDLDAGLHPDFHTDFSPGTDVSGEVESGPDVTTDVAPPTDVAAPTDLTSPPDTVGDPGLGVDTDAANDVDEGTESSFCGDGMRTGREQCEGIDLGDATCETLSFDVGTLICTIHCVFDTSGCADVPSDWLDGSWLYRKSLRIDATQVLADEEHFPVLVSTVDADLAARTLPSGDDLVFTDSGGLTAVPCEIEHWEPATGTLVAWVRVENLSSEEDTQLYLYYGNGDAGPPLTAGTVWDDEQTAVWHLGEPTVDEQTTGSHRDATLNGHVGTQSGNAAGAGRIGGAQHFDGLDDVITVSTGNVIQLGNTNVTISAWVQTTSTLARGIVVKSPLLVHVPDDKLFGINHELNRLGIDQGWVTYLGGASTITDGQWHHVAWVQVRDHSGINEQWRLYVDGVRESDRNANTNADPGDHVLRIGDGVPGSYFASPFAGAIDEVRISSTARSSSWIGTSFTNQSAPAAFVIFGMEQALIP